MRVKRHSLKFIFHKFCVILIIGEDCMIGNVFINEVFSRAIELYLKYKDKPNEPEYHRFLVMAIRTLVSIYGELDIINPYITQNEHNMGGFDSNLTKFGFPKSDLEDFKKQFLIFFEEAKNA